MKDKTNLEGKKLLIVEDVDTSLRFFKAALKYTKAELLFAETGEESIEIYDQNPDISLILLDLNLPGIDGFEVLKYIREKDSKIPIIVQSAYVLSGERKKSLELGANIFLEKPVRLEELFDAINGLI